MAEVKISNGHQELELRTIPLEDQKNNYKEVVVPPISRETNYSANDFLSKIEESTLNVKEKDTYANASPLGFFGYGMHLFTYALAVTGACEIDSLVIADALCIGGIAQGTAGICSFIQGKTIEASVFLLYSILDIMVCTNQIFTNCGWAPSITDKEYIAFYSFWVMLSIGLLGITFKKNVFLTLIVSFMLLMQIFRCIGIGLKSQNVIIASGVSGVLSALCSIYLGYAELLNESFEKTVFPLLAYEDLKKNNKKNLLK